MAMQIDIESATVEPQPDEDDIRGWIAAALSTQAADSDHEVSVRIVDIPEMSQLNQTYRGRNGPTNVLSFPADLPADVSLPLLGDIVICAPVVRKEAAEQHKDIDAHWAHMAIHGTLHLLGYDHIEESEALRMETVETEVLARMHYPDPYQTQPLEEHRPA